MGISIYIFFRDDFGMNSGPRSTPAITNEVVVCHSPDGVVLGIDSETGKSLWQRDLRKDYDSAKGFLEDVPRHLF